MSSKAERKRRKRTIIIAKGGRPRQDGPREPNGRLDRRWKAQESERSAVRTATEARQRLFGLPEAVCGQPDAMTVLGRLKLAQAISADQADAAMDWMKVTNQYRLAMGIAPVFDEPRSDESSSGMSEDEWIGRAKDRYLGMREVLDRLCEEVRSPAPKSALDVIVFRDVEMPELIGPLRLALNALHRHFNVEKRIGLAIAS